MQDQIQNKRRPSAFLTGVLVAVFVLNQFVISNIAEAVGKQSATRMFMSLTMKTANAQMMIMPVLNEDGATTSLKEMPTITEVAGEPNSGDTVADAMAVMMATGTPFYAPEGITFDDPVGSLAVWGQYEQGITLSDALEERYQRIIGVFPCSFCCGGPMSVTVNGRCGCAHARAARGFFRYMLDAYGETYTNEQLVGEAYRWQAIWYPAGAVEDYLLATGRSEVVGHNSHGGAGSDGMHGVLVQ